MIKPTKTKTGKWTAQVYLYTDENGKKVHPRLTCDTKEELMLQIALLKSATDPKIGRRNTVKSAVEEYIKQSEFLSPTTLAGYRKILNYSFKSIMNLPIDKLDDSTMQAAINLESKRKVEKTGKTISAKTVINEYGLLSSALRNVCNKTFNVKLPKVQHKNEDLPEPADIMSAIVDTDVELPCLMAMWMSMSMSEIKGVMCSSIHDNVLYIDRVMIEADNKEIVKDHAKVDSRIRKIQIPDYIMNLIQNTNSYANYQIFKEDGFLITESRNAIYHKYKRLLAKKGMDISFHDLRHVFASVMLTKLQIPEKVVQAEGGWTSDHVMKRVYSQTFSESRRIADELRDKYFLENIPKDIPNDPLTVEK